MKHCNQGAKPTAGDWGRSPQVQRFAGAGSIMQGVWRAQLLKVHGVRGSQPPGMRGSRGQLPWVYSGGPGDSAPWGTLNYAVNSRGHNMGTLTSTTNLYSSDKSVCN